ncbi:transcriptional regulator [Sphingobacterium sp. SGG-5]|uniref:triple tyrosine motif-containing protein n=1 Tax=Sphingobacterium sp. SGG-5 TaxID=2710881 RepID=UPI0013EB9627|nr:triple tyrosine motif-containing protein [Sphingobacterium sp. SGG-5]NGM63326.1 transcriptional regulator [Sphingobacterium sp. SGG-5]
MKYFYLLFLTTLNINLSAQNPIGIPDISTYETFDYKGGTQNWDMDQDNQGIMYFANNEGLLTFDGRHWKLHPLPHKTIVRSIKISSEGKIYVGAQDEIGYFIPDINGTLKFVSLKKLIPEQARNFSDIWDIVILKNEVFFRTTDKIFHLKDDKIKVYIPHKLWEFMGEANGKLYAQDTGNGLLTFNSGKWESTPYIAPSNNDIVTSILHYALDTLLVTTFKSGIYLMGRDFLVKKTGRYDETFKEHRLYDAIAVNDNRYALATSSAGCYIINKQGEIIQQFSSEEGLYKNKLRSIFMDRNKNLWLGLDDGINFIAFNNAIRYIYPDKDKQTSAYSTLIHHNKLYVGTSNGVFYNYLDSKASDLSYSKRGFKEIPGTAGQTWNLNLINQHIIAGHEEGALLVDEKAAIPLYHSPGTWLSVPLSQTESSSDIITGTYQGLGLLTYNNGTFKVRNQIAGLNESIRFLIYDDPVLWASHPYRGVYKIELAPDKKNVSQLKLYTVKDGLPSTLGNQIAKIKNKIVVATQKGVYEFNPATDKFEPSGKLYPILGEYPYHYLNEDREGNIWFISNKNVGVVDFHTKAPDKDYNIVHFPELNGQVVAGFENIYHFNRQNVFIGAKKGLIHINYQNYLDNIKPLNTILSLVKASGEKDSILYGGYQVKESVLANTNDGDHEIALPKALNSLYFEYSSTLFEQQKKIEFSYQLVGFDKEWSEWSSKSEKYYTNIPKGNYVFKVKSRNNLGSESNEVSYPFTIKPAWYETYWIYLLYTLVLAGFIALLILRQKRKHEREREDLENKHQQEIEYSENEIVRLKNEKLESEVSFKNKELATTSMHLIKKNKLLSKIKKELLPIIDLAPENKQSHEIKKVIKLLNNAEKGDADWKQFSIHFDSIHSDFLSKLKDKFPNLSANDLKICAYIKMNLSSKEIAQLMSITIRAVEVSRYRLRKKLNVSANTNLFDYLYNIVNEE